LAAGEVLEAALLRAHDGRTLRIVLCAV